MIIFDTSVLTTQTWDSPIWEVLYALSASGTQDVAIPEVVHFELLAQRERDYRSVLDSAQSSYDALWAAQFNDDDGSAHWPAVSSEASHLHDWEQLYERAFKVLPLTLDAAREGLRREAYRLRPARASGKSAIGSRDSAIWMTVLEQARQASDKTVYFASKNSNDFGRDGKLFPELAQEAAAAGVTVEYLNDLYTVVAKFATTVPLQAGDEGLTVRVNSAVTQGWLHQFVVAQVTSGQFAATAVDFDDHEAPFMSWLDFSEWISTPNVQVLGWNDGARYEMEGSEPTLAATVRVLVVGVASRLDYYSSGEELAAFTVDVRLLFGTDSLTALASSTTQSLDEDEIPQGYDLAWKMADRLRGSKLFPTHHSNLRRVMNRPAADPNTA